MIFGNFGFFYVEYICAIINVELSIKKPILVNEVNVCGTLILLRESHFPLIYPQDDFR